jgi:hypothetical protein
MTSDFVDDLAGEVRRAASAAALSGLTTVATAAALAVGQLASSVSNERVNADADALGKSLITNFGRNVLGEVAQEVDAKGLSAGDVRMDTQLVAFASGQATTPVSDVVIEHDFALPLATAGAFSASATLTFKATWTFAAKNTAAKKSTSTKIEVRFDWSSESADEAKS